MSDKGVSSSSNMHLAFFDTDANKINNMEV